MTGKERVSLSVLDGLAPNFRFHMYVFTSTYNNMEKAVKIPEIESIIMFII